MIHPKTRWMLEEESGQQCEQASALTASLNLPPLVARLLVKRGISDSAAAHAFLYGGDEELHDPFLFKGMKEAVERIRLAEQRGEKIRIYGDYDADGVSSTSFMIRLFTKLGLHFDYYIPHRHLEGYGLNAAAIDKAAAAGVTLIVTVDTGISAVEQIQYARSLHIDVIVTDHHEPPELLPEACAIVNPKQADCPYPYKGLAGAGVAFKLGQALLGKPPFEWADITALGTIADLMPLTGENRYLVKRGLEQMRQTNNVGFQSLAEAAGIELDRVTSTNVAFGMAPRINASGRLEHADGAVLLLTTDDPDEAYACALRLDHLNKQRQQIVDEMVGQADELWISKKSACKEAGEKEPSVIVLAVEGWNVGVIGVVASKMIEKHYRPTIILGIDSDSGMCKGSARSIDGFDLYAALTECADLMSHYGGHQAAAGMSLHRDRLPEFEHKLSQLADQWLTAEDWIRKTTIDVVSTIQEAGLETIESLSLLEPFGAGNPSPKLLFRGVEVEESRTMGKDGKHLRLSLLHQAKRLEAISFGSGSTAARLSPGVKADILGELAVNEWNGNRKPQLMIGDMQVSHVQLFDYRNDSDPVRTMNKWLEQQIDRSRNNRTAVVVGSNPAWAETAAAVCVNDETGVRTAEDSMQVICMDYDTLPAELACTELLLLQKPPSAAKLSHILQACSGLESVVALYREDRRQRAGFPQRQHFAEIYQTVRRLPASALHAAQLPAKLSGMIGWDKEVVSMMLRVFEELEFIAFREGNVYVNPAPHKRELSESTAYRNALEQSEADQVLFASYQEFADWIALQLKTKISEQKSFVIV
ncbi:single-stranded-DNA-specific exonuclease RecJ [Paenibacillus abyssi]|uniref:Single-stranded-DNA-specific exonuclease RecJ n=1 Tax=Paenibacillus abyssi TaxID=1340531 RepID=A0A917LFP4_9BACL|nr:single-stranded-DNA-specific exonuclease RecJ [Paenibacillus abyssi]GGG19971.1 single-stranded-DNA-specific exonuclease RecJ [Paenibacillus abyssi]